MDVKLFANSGVAYECSVYIRVRSTCWQKAIRERYCVFKVVCVVLVVNEAVASSYPRRHLDQVDSRFDEYIESGTLPFENSVVIGFTPLGLKTFEPWNEPKALPDCLAIDQ